MSIEGERSELGDGGSFEHESLTLDELNQEFNELNEQLELESEHAEAAHQDYEELTEITEQLLDKLSDYGIDRLLGIDQTEEMSLCYSYMESLYNEHLETIAWAKEEVQYLHAQDGAVKILQKCIIENRRQQLVLINAAQIIYGEMNDRQLSPDDSKKSTQAQLHFLHKLPPTNNLVRFFAEVAPGENLQTADDLSDMHYVAATLDLQPMFDYFNAQEADTLRTAVELATYKMSDDFWKNSPDVVRTLTTLAGLYMLAASQSNGLYGEAARRSQLMWHYGYSTGMDTKTLKDVIDYYEQMIEEWGGDTGEYIR